MLLYSCQQKNEIHSNYSKLYVSSVNNLSTQKPFHEVLIQKKDTLLRYDFWKNEKSFATASFENNKIKDSISFNNGDQLVVGKNFTVFENFYLCQDLSKQIFTYSKTKSGQKLNSKDFIKQLEGKFFETKISNNKTPNSVLDIKETIEITKDSLTYYWDYFYENQLLYKESETVNLNFFEVEGQLFLVPSTQKNPYPILQVYKISNEELELRYFNDFEMKSKIYTQNKKFKTIDYSNYSLCLDYFQKIYYVGEQVRYKKGLDNLLSSFQKSAPSSENEGFINIHFTINCKGKVGRLGLELLDRNYQSTRFEPELIKHIVDKTLAITEWKNYDKDPYFGSKDVKKFFFIKIDNQKITDVCP